MSVSEVGWVFFLRNLDLYTEVSGIGSFRNLVVELPWKSLEMYDSHNLMNSVSEAVS